MADMADFIKNFAQMMSNSSENSDSSPNSAPQFNSEDSRTDNNTDIPNIDIETIMKISQIMSAMQSSNDSNGANLLRSLKPYLNPSRRSKVDEYIKLLNLGTIMKTMNNLGGDTKNGS